MRRSEGRTASELAKLLGKDVPPAEAPKPATNRRPRRRALWGAALAVLLLAAVATLVARYRSFDPQAFADDAVEIMTPIDPASVAAIQMMRDRQAVPEALARIDVPDLRARVERFERARDELRRAHHPDGSRCARYPDTRTVGDIHAAVGAIRAAGFERRLDDLLAEARSAAEERDAAFHPRDEAAEVIAHRAAEAGPWTRLGVLLRRSETEAAYRRARGERPDAGPREARAPGAAARQLEQDHGIATLLGAAMQIARERANAPRGRAP